MSNFQVPKGDLMSNFQKRQNAKSGLSKSKVFPNSKCPLSDARRSTALTQSSTNDKKVTNNCSKVIQSGPRGIPGGS